MIKEKEIIKQNSLLNAVIMCDAIIDTYSNGFTPLHFKVDKYGEIHEDLSNMQSICEDVYSARIGGDSVPDWYFHYDSAGSCMIVRAGDHHVVFFHTEENTLGIHPVKKNISLGDDWFEATENPMNYDSAALCGLIYDMNKEDE